MKLVNVPLSKITNQDLFQEQSFDSWRDFVTAIMEHNLGSGVRLWRGHGNSKWELESSYWRKHKEKYQCPQPFATFISDIHEAYDDLRRNTFSVEDVSNHLSLPLVSKIEFKSSDYKDSYRRLEAFNRQGNNRDNMNFGVPFDCTCHVPMDLRHWAWGQHYGIKSPLLDWTLRPFLALYFACEGYKKRDENNEEVDTISIYALNPSSLAKLNAHHLDVLDKAANAVTQEHINELIAKTNTFFKRSIFSDKVLKYEIKIEQPETFHEFYQLIRDAMKLKLILECNNQNQRQITQNGVFSYAPLLMSIEQWCKRYVETFADTELALLDKPLIKKYIIKFSFPERQLCLAFLDSANINAKTVYPDFQGLSKYMDELEAIRRVM